MEEEEEEEDEGIGRGGFKEASMHSLAKRMNGERGRGVNGRLNVTFANNNDKTSWGHWLRRIWPGPARGNQKTITQIREREKLRRKKGKNRICIATDSRVCRCRCRCKSRSCDDENGNGDGNVGQRTCRLHIDCYLPSLLRMRRRRRKYLLYIIHISTYVHT